MGSIKFTATLPIMLYDNFKRTTKREWLTLPEKDRDWTHIHGATTYRRRTAPTVNPAVIRLLRKLRRYKVKYTDDIIAKNGQQFIVITSCPAS